MAEKRGDGPSRRERLDVSLVGNGDFPSREAAKRAVMAGWVRVGGQLALKPGMWVARGSELVVSRPGCEYVSRGGLKLAHALALWPIPVEGQIALDVGASTGGFTDVLLRRGARRVYAVDVGYGQLAWKIRTHPNVVVCERQNIRHLKPEALYGAEESAGLAVIDVSFIGLAKVLPAVKSLLTYRGLQTAALTVVALLKPQFEAGPEKVGKSGIISDPQVHAEVLGDIREAAWRLGFELRDTARSPILGQKGNTEFLLWLGLST